MRRLRITQGLVLAFMFTLLTAVELSAAEVIGTVVSVSGSVWARAPGQAPRALKCGDPIQEGDWVEGPDDAHLGVLSDAVYTQVEPESRIRFEQTEAGVPDLELERGSVRVVDTKLDATAPRHRISTPHAQSRGHRGDTEAFVLLEKGGSFSLICEWAEAIGVSRPDGTVLAAPGECAVARRREALYTTPAQRQRIRIERREACAAPVTAGLTTARFSPQDVAAPPPSVQLMAPAPPPFELEPCDMSSCVGASPGVIESPVTPGSLPGGLP